MRIARWIRDGAPEDGFVVGDRVVAFPNGVTVAEVLRGGLEAAASLHCDLEEGGGTRLEEVTLLPPLEPAAIRDFVAFEEHVEGVSAAVDGVSSVPPEWHEAPTFYFTNPHTVLGPADGLAPPVSERLDFELEIACVLGGPEPSRSDLDREAAAAAIFGYTIMNDWSARDLQGREMKVKLGPAKGKDFGTTLGPWIVTADEFEHLHDEEGFLAIRAEARVNGELVGEDLVSNMGWTFPELVAYASRNSRVVPGDVLGSGTVGNGGCLAELWGRRGELIPAPLREGDVVSFRVEGIGELTMRVGPPVPSAWPDPARRRPRERNR